MVLNCEDQEVYPDPGVFTMNAILDYYGSIGNYDFSQAQPLQCGYPASPPDVGDYLTVEDTLPTPAVGQGYWYLTAVHYGGERRYGRKATGGFLSGRDPGVLPSCSLRISLD